MRAPAWGPRAPLSPYRPILPDGPTLTPLDFPFPPHRPPRKSRSPCNCSSPEPGPGPQVQLQTPRPPRGPRAQSSPAPAPPRTRRRGLACSYLPPAAELAAKHVLAEGSPPPPQNPAVPYDVTRGLHFKALNIQRHKSTWGSGHCGAVLGEGWRAGLQPMLWKMPSACSSLAPRIKSQKEWARAPGRFCLPHSVPVGGLLPGSWSCSRIQQTHTKHLRCALHLAGESGVEEQLHPCSETCVRWINGSTVISENLEAG